MHSVHDPLDALAGVDLNALVALDALLRTQSVTRAAERLGLTQSAMSHALKRLRNLFDDPLLVRAGAGMALTPHAESLQAPLHEALISVSRVVTEPSGFDPATSQRSFRILTPDLFDLLMLPTLLAAIGAEAPSVDLALMPHGGRRVHKALAAGDIDLAIVPVADWTDDRDPSTGLVRRTIFEDGYRCFVRRGHPAVRRGRLDLETYAGLSHLLVSPTGEGPGLVDPLLAAHGLRRRVGLRVAGFAVAARILADTDLVLTGPAGLRHVVDEAQVSTLKAPVDIATHGIAMLWHERFGADPAHRWLRDKVAAAAKRRGPGVNGRRSRRS